MDSTISRRDFCKFLAQSAIVGGVAPGFLGSCAARLLGPTPPVTTLFPSNRDQLSLAPGFTAREFIRFGERLNAQGELFGYNNDYIAFQLISPSEAWMWVNHESVHPGLVSGDWDMKRVKSFVDIEMKAVGGTLLHVRRENEKWGWENSRQKHRRLDAFSKIPFSKGLEIRGSNTAMGTLANCAGGTTPWGSFLSCEENYDQFYGDRKRGKQTRLIGSPDLAWHQYYDVAPEHYGWVVEITPEPFAAKKLVSLGRFAHECATVVEAKDGRAVVYMADDANNQCLYKFIADKPGSLDDGILYVASLESGTWIPLKKSLNRQLAGFTNDIEILTYTREAARLAGGTPLDRPEDVEIHPQTRAVFIALTNNKGRGRPFGSILKLEEEGRDPLSLRFRSENFVVGGESSGLACPDNLCFDARGNLWVTTDISGRDIGTPLYAPFGNNGLFLVPTSGDFAGRALRVAEAPRDAELTGPCFAPDGKSLFLSVQHPGELSGSGDKLTSHWPDGGASVPTPAVVEIESPFFQQ